MTPKPRSFTPDTVYSRAHGEEGDSDGHRRFRWDGGGEHRPSGFGWPGVGGRPVANQRKELRDFLQHYIDLGRRLSQSGRAVSRVKTAPDNQAVRAWARVQGMTVSPRGRISADVVAQYEAAGH